MYKFFTLAALGLLISFMPSSVLLAEDDSGRDTDENTVVVIANKQSRTVFEVVGAVSIIDAESIAITNSENLADALRYESNIDMENAGARFGSSGINIRGIGQNRVAVEVDGVSNAKQFSIGSYSNATSIFPETDLIKRIEILNGPASTLYGSDAIGGIVSIQTWDPVELIQKSSAERYSKLRIAYDGKNQGQALSAITAWQSEQFDSMVSVTTRQGKELLNHDSITTPADSVDWSENNIFTKFVWNTNESDVLRISLNASNRKQDTEINSFLGQERFSRTTELIGNDAQDNYKVIANYDFSLDNNWFDDGLFKAYYGATSFEQTTNELRSSRRGTPLAQYRYFEYQQSEVGIELNLNKTLNSDNATHSMIFGIDINYASIEELRDGSETNLTTGITNTSILSEEFPRRDFPNSDVDTVGLFVLDEIKIDGTPWTLIPAIRVDHYQLSPSRDSLFDANGTDTEIVSISETDFSPKLGAMYEWSDNTNVYFQYVHGFRAPPFDDVNIGLNIPLFNIKAIANPDLRSESSDGYEIGLRTKSEDQYFEATVFLTNYQDFIESKAIIGIEPETGALLFQSRNIEEAKISGVELSHRWQIGPQLKSYSTLSTTRGDNEITNQPLNSISPAKFVHNLEWTGDDGHWSVNLYSSFVKKVSRVDETNNDYFKPSGYAVFDLFYNYNFSDKHHIQVGLFNLTNKKYWNWQQVKNFSTNETIIDSLSQPSRTLSVSYHLYL